MKKFFILMMILFSVRFAISAGNPLWMVSSKEALTSYAIGQVSCGSVSVWAPSSVYGEEYTNNVYCALPVGERKDAFKVLAQLKESSIYFSVARPEVDWLNSYIGLYNSDGWSMFYGWGYGKLSIDTSGKWVPPASLLKFEANLAWTIPLLKDVSQAKVLIRDEYGNVIRTQYLEIGWNGEIMFTRDYVGQNGELIVTMEDGSSIVASLKDDKVYEVIAVSAKIDASIAGVVFVPNDVSQFKVNPASYKGYGESPLIRGNFTANQSFTLKAQTTEGELPRGVWFRDVESSEDSWTYMQAGRLGDMSFIFFGSGTYEFILDWEFFAPVPINYYDDGGGKG